MRAEASWTARKPGEATPLRIFNNFKNSRANNKQSDRYNLRDESNPDFPANKTVDYLQGTPAGYLDRTQ